MDKSRDEPMNYETLIDRAMWRFIERTDSVCRSEALSMDSAVGTVDGAAPSETLSGQRAIYEAMCQHFSRKAISASVSVSDLIYSPSPKSLALNFDMSTSNPGSVAVRRYSHQKQDTSATIMYFHGGGYTLGGLESHHDVCTELCERVRCDLVAVDYRLAPEHKHPAAFEDCLLSVLYALECNESQNIILCGDSAGGNLCAAVSHALRHTNLAHRIAGQVLIYPELGGDLASGSAVKHSKAPLFTTSELHACLVQRADGPVPSDDPTFAPLVATDYKNLPDTIVFAAQCDPLADDGLLYCNRINEAGGSARFEMGHGLVHGYIRARHSSDRAANSFDQIVNSLEKLAAK